MNNIPINNVYSRFVFAFRARTLSSEAQRKNQEVMMVMMMTVDDAMNDSAQLTNRLG